MPHWPALGHLVTPNFRLSSLRDRGGQGEEQGTQLLPILLDTQPPQRAFLLITEHGFTFSRKGHSQVSSRAHQRLPFEGKDCFVEMQQCLQQEEQLPVSAL